MGAEQAGAVGRGRVGRQLGEPRGDQLAGADGVAAGDQGVGGADHETGVVDPEPRDPVGVLEQLQRLLVVVGRLVGTADGHRLVARLDARRHRPVEVVGPAGVERQLRRGPPGGAAGQRGDVARVQSHPLPRQQVVVDRLTEQRVTEGVEVAADLEYVHLDGLPDAGVELVGRHVGGGGEQVVGDPSTRDAGDPDDLPGALGEPVEAHQQQVGEVTGDVAVGAGARGDELLDEEGVALGPLDDPAHRALVETGRRELVDQRPHGLGRQRAEGEPPDLGQPGPLGDLAAQRVAAVQVVGAVGRDDGDRAREGAGEQEAEHVAGGLVGPVEVLDDEQHGGLGGGRLEQGVHGHQGVAAVGAAAVLVGGVADDAGAPARLEPGQGRVHGGDGLDQVGVALVEPAEHLAEGEIGQGAVAEVETVAGQDLPAGVEGVVAQRPQQAGLADAGVAGQQHRPLRRPRLGGAHGVVEHGDGLGELGVSPDHGQAAVCGHGHHHDVRHRQDRHGCDRLSASGAPRWGRWPRSAAARTRGCVPPGWRPCSAPPAGGGSRSPR